MKLGNSMRNKLRPKFYPRKKSLSSELYHKTTGSISDSARDLVFVYFTTTTIIPIINNRLIIVLNRNIDDGFKQFN